MKVTALQPAIICFFSVLIQIQSDEIIYVYNYEDFSEIFQQGGLHNFNVAKYQDIDNIFDKPYEGSNIGGAFLLYGDWQTNPWHEQEFDGYVVDVTASFYCGKKTNDFALWINYPDGKMDHTEICSDSTSWNYNYKWIPPTRFNHTASFTLGINANGATVNEPFGFDKIRIKVTDTPPKTTSTPPQLLTATNPASAPKKSP